MSACVAPVLTDFFGRFENSQRAGLVRVDNNNRMLQRGNRFDELVEKLRASEAEAKDSHYGMWEFGDIDYDEPDMDPDRAWASKLKDKASTSS